MGSVNEEEYLKLQELVTGLKVKLKNAGYDKDELLYLVKKCLEYEADQSDDNKWKAIEAVVLVTTENMKDPVRMKSYVDNMSETRGDTVITVEEQNMAEDKLDMHMLKIDNMGLTKNEKQIVMAAPIDPSAAFANYTSLSHDPHEPAGPPPETYGGGGRKKSRRRTKRRKSKRRKSKKKRTRRRRR